MDKLPHMRHQDVPDELNGLTFDIIGAALEVHKAFGAGCVERVYKSCLAEELVARGRRVRREVVGKIAWRGKVLPHAFRMDLVVDDRIVIELKTVETILPVHRAQLHSYLKLSGLRAGLLINFRVPYLRDGIVRIVN